MRFNLIIVFCIVIVLGCNAEQPINESSKLEKTSELPVYNGLKDIYTKEIDGQAVEFAKVTGESLTGIVEVKFEDKLWSRKEYKNGLPHNLHVMYHKNGNKRQEFTYRNGVKIGVHKTWHSNGKPYWVNPFSDSGETHGDFKQWNQEGELVVDATYENGMLTEVRLNTANRRLNTQKNYAAKNIIENG